MLNRFYLWILDLMKRQPPRQTTESEIIEAERKRKFYEKSAKEQK